MNMKVVIFRETNDNSSHICGISKIVLLPSRPGAVSQTSICLILTGSSVNAQYSGAVCKITANKSVGYQMNDDSSFNSCINTYR